MITTQNYSIEDGESGIQISFPRPPNLRQSQQYVLYFDTPITLPKNPPVSVTFEPSNGSYVIKGSSSFIPRVFVKIKSLQKVQTKTLIRLIIKDATNNILHTDYLLVVCSPLSLFTIEGTLLPSNQIGGVGPNGGSILQLNSASSTKSITVGSIVRGPGIPTSNSAGSSYTYTTSSVKTILSETVIELNQLINNGNQSFSGTYEFSVQVGCVDASQLVQNNSFSAFTVLDYKNNWTYKVRNQVIAKFIVNDPNNHQDTVILLPIKNTALLGQSSQPQPIPEICIVKAGGRVINDTIPISVF